MDALNRKLMTIGRKGGMAALLAVSTLAMPWASRAAGQTAAATTGPSVMDDSDQNTQITLQPGRAKRLAMDHKIKRANILNPDIADVVPLEADALLLTGKKPGITQLIVWDEADHTQIMDVVVSSPVDNLRRQLATLFPGAHITADDNDGTIALHGQVPTLQIAQEAEQLAVPYGAKVLNLLEVAGGQQVMLRVRFAEVSKQAENELSFNFGGTDTHSFFGTANIGAAPMALATSVVSNPTAALANGGVAASTAMFGQGTLGKIAFQYFINALETDSVLRMLAEPDLVTTSGQEATFLAGGSFPYPVPQSGTNGASTVTIQFQDYGVNLRFTPIVLGDGRIRLKVAPEVSELDYSHTASLDGTVVPGLTKRNVNTTVELAEGQTLAIGGLLQDDVTATNSQLPLLGDLPVLGALFRSVSYQKNETELVVLVTPVLVHGMDPADVTPAPGEHWRDPSAAALYLMKDMGGESSADAQAVRSGGPAPGFEGSIGFQPPPASAYQK